MRSTRRDFLQVSATAASALALRPLVGDAAADPQTPESPRAQNPGVKAFEDRMLRAKPVALDKVRLTGGPLKHAQDMDGAYLLSLDPDRMLAYFRIRAGLAQKAEPYGGWDGDHHNLTGHICGHHLSAVSLMYLNTGDARFKARADYLVGELKVVQDKQGDGYVSALELGRTGFGELSKGDIRSQAFDLNGMWSPWYVLHKLFAGLRDAYRHAGNRTALDISIKFAGWAEGILKPLTDTQVQHMLNTEHGGMNEVLADLYADTGDTRWLDLSYRFEHHAFTDALKRSQDNLNGKHGNCQIPKLCGSAARYGYVGDPGDILAAGFFWDAVTEHHSYATGGHGLDEYFGPADQLSKRVDGRTCESCNVYNMLKLTRRLFSLRPDPFYADFHERALFNHVLASMDPEDGRTSYMVPVGRGVMQEYQDMQRSFTCCVGSGMESHALHADGLYYESGDTLWVNIFAPSTAEFTNAGLSLKMDTGFPDGDTATIGVTARAPKTMTIAVRRPSWAGDAFSIKVNGAPVDVPTLASLRAGGAGGRDVGGDTGLQPSSFVELKRTWKTGDTIELIMPKSLRLDPTPDDKTVAAIMWGPLVLAGDFGVRSAGRRGGGAAAASTGSGQAGPGPAGPPAPSPIPALMAADTPLTDWLVPAAAPGNFTVTHVARVPGESTPAPDVPLAPFYRTQRHTYAIYFDVITPAELTAREAAMTAARDRARKIETATVGFVQPGDASQEGAANFQSEPPPPARPPRTNGRASRGGAGGWFSYDLPVDPSAAMALVVTYLNPSGQPAQGNFQILVDGTEIAHFEPNPSAEGFYDTVYPLTPPVTQGKTKITVRFQAAANGRIAPVFGVRTVRADSIR